MSTATSTVMMDPAERDLLYERRLAKKDFLDCILIRKKALIDQYERYFEGKSVLEIGSHAGLLSRDLASRSRSLTLLENNPQCVALLEERFESRAEIIEGDVHHALWRLQPGRFDVIVCAGILYHSLHPFFLLEGLAHLRPRKVLLDTLLSEDGSPVSLVPYANVNQFNYRYNSAPDCPFILRLNEPVIESAMTHLGFRLLERIDKSSLEIAPEADSAYFQKWKQCHSAWWSAE